MNKKTILFLAITLSEIIISICLLLLIMKKITTKLQVNITPIKKNTLDFPYPDSSHFKNFYEPKPNIIASEDERWLLFKPQYILNKDSFNEIKDYSIVKPNNTFRIIAIGDSFTYGQYVNTKDNWTELLESDLNIKCTKEKYEVINLGMGGYDLAYSVHRYQTRGEKYSPDLILFLLKEDDFEEIKDVTAKVKLKYADDFINDPKNATELKKETIGIELNLKTVKEGNKVLRKFYTESEVIDYQINYLKQLIDNNRDIFIFNIFGYSTEVKDKILKTVRGNSHVVFETNELQIKDLTISPYNYLPYDYHMTVKGHILLKDKIFDYLVTNMHIPCK